MSKLSGLQVPALEPERLAALRQRAASLLVGGADKSSARYQATEALTVLHALASSQASAPDALALLHELQVHQVELELQAQELRESRSELEAALQRQMALYEHQPMGCISVDQRLTLQQLNHRGAELLGVERHEALGLPFEAFMCLHSASRLRAAMAQASANGSSACCQVTLLSRQGPPCQMLATVGVDPSSTGYLVNVTPPAAAPGGAPEAR